MDVVIAATRGKGALGNLSGPRRMLKRVGIICQRYGWTPAKMDQTLAHFVAILERFGCGATFPVTAAALARSPDVIERYQARDIEFAVHGYRHVDHRRLPLAVQIEHLHAARRLCQERGITASGFRCPYLRWSGETLKAVREAGFLYDSSQALAWDLTSAAETAAYQHVLGFYGAISAASFPALPHHDGIVRIPYGLPDDEGLVDRLQLKTARAMAEEWLSILARTYDLGELFTLGLHPERIYPCQAGLIETLRQARSLSPRVWIARLDEVARWWIARAGTVVTIIDSDAGDLELDVDGPDGVTVLVRGVEVMGRLVAWDGIYQEVKSRHFRLRAPRRPFIGVSRSSSFDLIGFLRQQGYIVEYADHSDTHTLYLDRPTFGRENERELLAEIERGARSLVRLGRWPHGARSALCVTGDIDALTIWDYGLRLLGR